MVNALRTEPAKSVSSKAIKDPERMYDTPSDVMKDDRLPVADKKRILESWALDMEALLRAEEENMTKTKPRYHADERLREIQKYCRELEGQA